MDNIYVYIVDLPLDVAEMIAPCGEGFTIYLNARLSYQGRIRACLHALEHVKRNDWNQENVQQIESETHKIKFPALRQQDEEWQ